MREEQIEAEMWESCGESISGSCLLKSCGEKQRDWERERQRLRKIDTRDKRLKLGTRRELDWCEERDDWREWVWDGEGESEKEKKRERKRREKWREEKVRKREENKRDRKRDWATDWDSESIREFDSERVSFSNRIDGLASSRNEQSERIDWQEVYVSNVEK